MGSVDRAKAQLISWKDRTNESGVGARDIRELADVLLMLLENSVETKDKPDRPPLVGEIAYLRYDCVRHPIIFTDDGWRLCAPPSEIDPIKIDRDEVCRKG